MATFKAHCIWLSFQALILQRPCVVLLNEDEDEPEAGK